MKAIVRIASTILMMAYAVIANAQQGELVVDTMYYDATDLEAQANIEYDNNKQPYALIKIEIPLDGVQVEQNATVGKTVHKTGELWAYVTADPDYGATDIVLQHSEFHALRVSFVEWGLDELKGKCVYRIRVSVPSAVVAQANRFYEKLRFGDAQEMYDDIVNNASSSEFDRNFARKRLALLPQLMAANENATLYAKRYKKPRRPERPTKTMSSVLSTVLLIGITGSISSQALGLPKLWPISSESFLARNVRRKCSRELSALCTNMKMCG